MVNYSLETKRLKLIPFELNDLDLIHRTFTDRFIRKYLWDDEIIDVEKSMNILERNEEHFKNDKWGLWKIILKSDNSYVGFAGLWIFFEEEQPQLLYSLLQNKTGFGYATEASKGVIDYAFNDLAFGYLVGSVDTPNKKSIELCQRLNMKFVEEKLINNKPITFFKIRKENNFKNTN